MGVCLRPPSLIVIIGICLSILLVSVECSSSILNCSPDCVNGECQQGVCICKEGWQGKRCLEPVCPGGCANGGRCNAPNECLCTENYTGPNCTTLFIPHSESEISKFGTNTRVINTYYNSFYECSVIHGHHVKTFDGNHFSYPLRGGYTLFMDCFGKSPLYYVFFNSSFQCTNQKTQNDCSLSLKITVGTQTILIVPHSDFAFINNKKTPIPFNSNGVIVSLVGSFIKIKGVDDTEILYDKDRNIYIYAPVTAQNKLCGLCGYFNGNPNDDYQDFNKVIQKTVKQFVNSWIDRDPSDRNLYPELDVYPCNALKTSQPDKYKNALSLCQNMVKDSLGRVCQNLVSIDRYLNMCQDEVCECLQNQNKSGEMDSCFGTFCKMEEQYSYACTLRGISVDWRSSGSICKQPQCTNGKEFSECGSGCGKMCGELDMELECENQCLPGCYCPRNRYWDGNNCVPKEKCPCVRNNGETIYQQGYRLKLSCETCICGMHGKWKCVENEECEGRCFISGDPHYLTFDRRHFFFDGNCEYTAVMTTSETIGSNSSISPLSVTVKNNECSDNREPNCLRIINVIIGQDEDQVAINLQSFSEVKANFRKVSLPYKRNNYPAILIDQLTTDILRLKSETGVEILWNGGSRVEIKLSKKYQGKVVGMCGNFNGNEMDDSMTFNGVEEKDIDKFIQSWKTNPKCEVERGRVEYNGACALSKSYADYANKVCNQLIENEEFKKCHSLANVDKFVEQCQHDVCTCGMKKNGALDHCECDAFSSFARQCVLENVNLKWRTDKICLKQCPNDKMIFNQCGSRCTSSCRLLQDSSCKEECVEGCFCPEGETFDEISKTCVKTSECQCEFYGHFYKPYETRQDQCNNCTCTKGNWVCTNNECQGKDICPNSMQWFDCGICQKTCSNLELVCPNGECQLPGCFCPENTVLHNGKCIKPYECPCYMNNKIYSENDNVMKGPANCQSSCVCKGGKWICEQNTKCNGLCRTWGETHYESFDGKYFEFTGSCSYVISEDYCGNKVGTFRLIAENVACGSGSMSCTKAVKFIYLNQVFQFVRGSEPVISKNTNYSPGGPIAVYWTKDIDTHLILFTKEGIQIIWDKAMSLEINLPENYQNKVCGLCGNFDLRIDNDMRARSGEIEKDVLSFTDSWKIHSSCPIPQKPAAACSKRPDREPWAKSKCEFLKSDSFKKCHDVVNVEHFYKRCVEDACSCDRGDDCICFCTAVEQYVARCNEYNIGLEWRNNENCPHTCTGNREWKTCGNICPDSCTDIKQNETQSSDCKNTCIEGCFCSEGYHWQDNKCVERKACECIDPITNIKYNAGDKFVRNCEECNCFDGTLKCTKLFSKECLQTSRPEITTKPPYCNNENEFLCPNNFCARRCNAVIECRDGEDEEGCSSISYSSTTTPSTTTTKNLNYCITDQNKIMKSGEIIIVNQCLKYACNDGNIVTKTKFCNLTCDDHSEILRQYVDSDRCCECVPIRSTTIFTSETTTTLITCERSTLTLEKNFNIIYKLNTTSIGNSIENIIYDSSKEWATTSENPTFSVELISTKPHEVNLIAEISIETEGVSQVIVEVLEKENILGSSQSFVRNHFCISLYYINNVCEKLGL